MRADHGSVGEGEGSPPLECVIARSKIRAKIAVKTGCELFYLTALRIYICFFDLQTIVFRESITGLVAAGLTGLTAGGEIDPQAGLAAAADEGPVGTGSPVAEDSLSEEGDEPDPQAEGRSGADRDKKADANF